MNHQKTLLLIKPDGIKRALIGEIISRIEKKGLKIIGLKMLQIDETFARKLYDIHVSKKFFPQLMNFITSGPIIAMAVEGPSDCITLVRNLMGATRHNEAQPGSIRGDYSLSTTENLVHGTDSPERAMYELPLFFEEDELFPLK